MDEKRECSDRRRSKALWRSAWDSFDLVEVTELKLCGVVTQVGVTGFVVEVNVERLSPSPRSIENLSGVLVVLVPASGVPPDGRIRCRSRCLGWMECLPTPQRQRMVLRVLRALLRPLSEFRAAPALRLLLLQQRLRELLVLKRKLRSGDTENRTRLRPS